MKNLMVISLLTLASNFAFALPVQKISSFDNQIMTCSASADVGRMAYQLTSASGLIKNGNVEISIGFETLKCSERAGVFGFEKSRLNGRTANTRGGFVELSNLEMVSYTPDFTFVRALPVNMGSTDQTVTFIGPVASFASLLPRNVNGVGDRRITHMAFLRAKASLGDAKTGLVQTTQQISFGVNSFILSEADRTLNFATGDAR